MIVPMDDWLAEAGHDFEEAAAGRVVRGHALDEGAIAELVELLSGAAAPALVVGAGADDAETWAALVELSELLECPVWQESFGARAGFPQDHPRFAGHLPADRTRLRQTLAPHDVVLVVGAPALRQYPFEPGPFVDEGTRLVVVSQDPGEVHRSPAEPAVLACRQRCAPSWRAACRGSATPHRPRVSTALLPRCRPPSGSRSAQGMSSQRWQNGFPLTPCSSRRHRRTARSFTLGSRRGRHSVF